MRHFRKQIDIDATPERVWAVMTDFVRWPEWTASITSVEPLNPGPPAPGYKVKIRQPGFPAAFWKITEITAPKDFTWVSEGPGVRVVAQHAVETRGTGAKVTLSLEFEGLLGALFGRLTREVNNRYLGLEAEGLKARSEGLR